MARTFCELWWQIEDRLMGYRVRKPGLAYLDFPRDQIDSILSELQQDCEQLGAPELFEQSDRNLSRVNVDSPLEGTWGDLSLLQPAGLRVPRIQDGCFRYAILRGEICSAWEISPPKSPVNSVNALIAFLRGQWNQNYQRLGSGEIEPEDLIEVMSPVLQNVRHTISWLESRGVLSELTIVSVMPRSVLHLQTYIQQLEEWLNFQASSSPALPQATPGQLLPDDREQGIASTAVSANNEPPKRPYLDLVVDASNRTVGRRGAEFNYLDPIRLDGSPVVWPLFYALFLKAGDELTPNELTEISGDRSLAAWRTAKGRLNNTLLPLGVKVPAGEWRLIER